jgi:hypothetical protein
MIPWPGVREPDQMNFALSLLLLPAHIIPTQNCSKLKF